MIIGAGAREHALALAHLRHPRVEDLLVTPGNDAMRRNLISRDTSKILNIGCDPASSLKDPKSFLRIVKYFKPTFIEVAQDDALALGTVDLLTDEKVMKNLLGDNVTLPLVLGPTKLASQIEWDKDWTRKFCQRHDIAIPEYMSFKKGSMSAIDYGLDMLQRFDTVYFKAAGLYAGKGVVPAERGHNDDQTRANVMKAWEAMNDMEEASEIFLIEEGMVGDEFSYYALVDGEHFICFRSSQDNKRVYENDKGPNTGGMGANCPTAVTGGLERRIEKEIIAPAVKGLKKEDRPYKGVLYLGGMRCRDGSLKVTEFNSRHGDPEVHVVLGGVRNYHELAVAAVEGRLATPYTMVVDQDNKKRVCVIGCSDGYPGSYKKGLPFIIDREKLPKKGLTILSAGLDAETEASDPTDDELVNADLKTAGGRLVSFVGEDDTFYEARAIALAGLEACSIEGAELHHRKDIAHYDIKMEGK